jgi:MATE family multidrug resistance protein
MAGEDTWLGEYRALARLSGPLIAGYAGNQLVGTVDAAIVGRLGAVPLAAVSYGNALFGVATIFGIGMLMGLDPIAAQAVGSGRPGRARQALGEGIRLALAVTIPLTGLLFGLCFAVLEPVGVDAASREQTLAYLVGRGPSILPVLAFTAGRAFLQALGTVRPILVATVLANLFNLPATALLSAGDAALGWVGLPPLGLGDGLGVLGAGIGSFGVALLQLWVAWAAVRRVDTTAGAERPTAQGVRTLVQVGWPVGAHLMAEMGMFALAAVVMGHFGPNAGAAHNVAISLAGLTFTVCLGLGNAGAVRVGQAIGRRDHPGMRRAGFASLTSGTGFMALGALVFLVFPEPLARLFTRDPAVIDIAVDLLRVAAVFQIVDGLQAVGAGVLRGAGDTRFAMILNLSGHWLVAVPAGFVMAFRLDWGPVGLWWGLNVGLTLVGVGLSARFVVLSRRPVRAVEEDCAPDAPSLE